jgi:hypothetical protein
MFELVLADFAKSVGAGPDHAVGDRCIALTQQPDIIRNSTLFHWWPGQRARS